MSDDKVLPFQLEKAPVRGRLVRLSETVTTILHRHDYPHAVGDLLAQAAAMAAALGTALKFDGVFTLQTKTDGPVHRLVVDVTSDGAVRACAQFDASRIEEGARPESLLGHGHLVFTVDQKASDERYQGVVALTGDSLTQAFQHYFRQSEQIPTGLFAAAQRDSSGGWLAGCLMLQRMPDHGGAAESPPIADTSVEDDWLRVMTLMNTCTAQELLAPDLPMEDLLYRLFHEEGVRVFEARALCHACRCSAQRVKDVLAAVPRDELRAMFENDGTIRSTCQFCSRDYVFTPGDFPESDPAKDEDSGA